MMLTSTEMIENSILNLIQFLSNPNQNISPASKGFKKLNNLISFFCIFSKILIFLFLFKTITAKSSNANKKEAEMSKIMKNRYPDDLEFPFRNLFHKKNSIKCFDEIGEIYKRDFSRNNTNTNSNSNGKKSMNKKSSKEINSFNPYSNINLNEKSFSKIFKNFKQKLNKLEFHEHKNFTGIRWVNYNDTKNYEIKKKSLTYLDNIYEYFEKTYSKCNRNLPEIIVESYLFFNNKIKELKKIFGKFYLFKGIKKFMKCYEKYEPRFTREFFMENLRTGNFSSKNFIEKLNKIFLSVKDLIRSQNVREFSNTLKLVIFELRGIPGF